MHIKIRDQSCYFFQSLLLVTIRYSIYAQRAKHVVVLSPCVPVINPCDIFTKMDNWRRELANKDESAAKKGKVMTLEEKFVLNINGIV